MELGRIDITGRPRAFAVPTLARPATASFGRAIKLLGMDGPADITVKAGQSVTVTLVWQALSTPPGDWVRFLHALGSDGRPVAQVDGRPCAGACPVTSWLPGEVVTDAVRFTAPVDLPAGVYPFATGWYDPAASGMPRLAAQDAGGDRVGGDLVSLPARLVITP
jgi:hypothetical protein